MFFRNSIPIFPFALGSQNNEMSCRSIQVPQFTEWDQTCSSKALEDSGNFHDFQLWRVMHTMVVARENPNLEAQVLEATLLGTRWMMNGRIGPGFGLKPLSDAIRIELVRQHHHKSTFAHHFPSCKLPLVYNFAQSYVAFTCCSSAVNSGATKKAKVRVVVSGYQHPSVCFFPC